MPTRSSGPGHTLRGEQVRDAYQRLREAIIRGTLAPGARLLETEIAARLGLSRSSIRTAIHRLQQEGFVAATSNGLRTRLVVCPLTRDDFWELSEIVGELEGLAAQRVARLSGPARRGIVTDLRRANDAMQRAVQADPRDRAEVFELDDRFHNCLVEAAGSRRLTALHHAVKPQMQRYEGVYFTMAGRAHESVAEHDVLVDAIEAGEPDVAHRAVRTNEMNAARHLVKYIESLGERGNF